MPNHLNGLYETRNRLAFLAQKLRSANKLLRYAFWRRIVQWHRGGGWLPRSLQSVIQANRHARRDYTPRPYRGHVTLFRVNRHAALRAHDPLLGWGSLVSHGPDVQEVPGTHLTMVFEPHVRTLAEKLTRCLEEAWTGSTPSTYVPDDHKAASCPGAKPR